MNKQTRPIYGIIQRMHALFCKKNHLLKKLHLKIRRLAQNDKFFRWCILDFVRFADTIIVNCALSIIHFLQVGHEVLVQLGAHGLAAGLGDDVTGLDTAAVEFGMTEEGNVNHDCHAGNQLEVTVGAEEGSFCFHQADGVGEGTYQVVLQTVLFVVLTAGNVDLDTAHTGLQHFLGQTQGLTHVVQQILLALSEHAVDGDGVTEGAGIAVDTGSDTDHNQFAVLHLTVGCGGNNSLCASAGANDAGVCKGAVGKSPEGTYKNRIN